jgi:hypothetical protein
LDIELRRRGNKLTIQFDGEPEFEMEHDIPLSGTAFCSRGAKSTVHTLSYGIALVVASRLSASEPLLPLQFDRHQPRRSSKKGNYSFSRTIGLRVYASGRKLMVQGTGQTRLEVTPFKKDVFVTEPIGAEVAFQRDANGKVIALTVDQRGQVLRGERH